MFLTQGCHDSPHMSDFSHRSVTTHLWTKTGVSHIFSLTCVTFLGALWPRPCYPGVLAIVWLDNIIAHSWGWVLGHNLQVLWLLHGCVLEGDKVCVQGQGVFILHFDIRVRVLVQQLQTHTQGQTGRITCSHVHIQGDLLHQSVSNCD